MPLRSLDPNQLLDYFAAELTELLEATAVDIGQLVVVETEQMQESHVDVTDGMNDLDGFGTDLISRTDNRALLNTAASEPHVHSIDIMTAAKGC